MSMRHARPLLLVLVVTLLAVACDRGDDQPEASPTAEAPPLAVATASATAPPATPTPLPGSIEVASTVQLIDVRTGAVKTLYQDTKQQAYSAAFEGDDVLINAGQFLRFHLDGTPATGTPMPRDFCRNVNGAAEIGGRSYGGVRCGSISPDGRQMAYTVQNGEVEVGTAGYRVRLDDMWAIDLQTGATRRLHSGLIDCGGCDARYRPRWSPSSRYVAYAEFGGQARRFLSDLMTGTTRQIANGNEITDAPVWAPTSDLLIYSTASHGTVARFEDLAASTSRDLAVAWPVRFDARALIPVFAGLGVHTEVRTLDRLDHDRRGRNGRDPQRALGHTAPGIPLDKCDCRHPLPATATSPSSNRRRRAPAPPSIASGSRNHSASLAGHRDAARPMACASRSHARRARSAPSTASWVPRCRCPATTSMLSTARMGVSGRW